MCADSCGNHRGTSWNRTRFLVAASANLRISRSNDLRSRMEEVAVSLQWRCARTWTRTHHWLNKNKVVLAIILIVSSSFDRMSSYRISTAKWTPNHALSYLAECETIYYSHNRSIEKSKAFKRRQDIRSRRCKMEYWSRKESDHPFLPTNWLNQINNMNTRRHRVTVAGSITIHPNASNQKAISRRMNSRLLLLLLLID